MNFKLIVPIVSRGVFYTVAGLFMYRDVSFLQEKLAGWWYGPEAETVEETEEDAHQREMNTMPPSNGRGLLQQMNITPLKD